MDLIGEMNSFEFGYFGNGVDPKTIKVAEQSLELSFSKEYGDYLREFGIAAVNGRELTGLTPSKRLNVVFVTQEERQYHTVPNDWYVVEQLHIDGVVVWQSTNGEVYQSLPGQLPTKLCNSLLEYIKL